MSNRARQGASFYNVTNSAVAVSSSMFTNNVFDGVGCTLGLYGSTSGCLTVGVFTCGWWLMCDRGKFCLWDYDRAVLVVGSVSFFSLLRCIFQWKKLVMMIVSTVHFCVLFVCYVCGVFTADVKK